MKVYETISLIHCDIQDLFDFHLDVKNLQAISPKNIKVTLLNENFIPKEGEVLRLKTVKNFIPIMWEVQIAKLQPPNLLVDKALKSPFSFWEHSHSFTQEQNGMCELRDVVRYKAPFGFVGVLFDFIIRYELDAMFKFRHQVTKEILEKKL
jgi:ligand-binding SRPBCC domain-containing protein